MSETLQTVAQFKIPYIDYLDKDGKATRELPAFVKDTEHLLALYRMMLKTRLFDSKAIALQRTGKLGTYPSTLGQEAIGVGIGAAMKPEDVLCPYYREYGAQFWRKVRMEEILLYWGGDERGSQFQDCPEDFPISVPIASQNLHAVGVATAFKLRNQARVAVTTVGDGGTSRGDFYEAVNVAGIWNLPAVFVINNNQWAISVRREHQTLCETIAQKGIAGGVESLQCDGNDIIGMQQVMSEALEKARAGNGPTVIEAITYRMCDHTTADDASRYRPKSELDENQEKDPILRLNRYLTANGLWDDDKEKSLKEALSQEIETAVETYLNTPRRAPESMLEYLYEKCPSAYEDQYLELKARGR